MKKTARCHDFIMALPEGYDTVIGGSGGTLSGGERQRLSIARAIMKDSPIIVLDEATANVDPENEKELMEAIAELTEEKTILMIAHRLKTVQGADQILVVDQGRIVQKGTHAELMQEEGIYRRFIGGRQQAVSWKIKDPELWAGTLGITGCLFCIGRNCFYAWHWLNRTNFFTFYEAPLSYHIVVG